MFLLLEKLPESSSPMGPVGEVLEKRFHQPITAPAVLWEIPQRFTPFQRLDMALRRYVRRYRLQPITFYKDKDHIFYAGVFNEPSWHEMANPRILKWMLQQLRRTPPNG